MDKEAKIGLGSASKRASSRALLPLMTGMYVVGGDWNALWLGIRSDSTHSNYNGAPVTGVAKKEERWRVEVQRRAVDLDAECFGVQPPAVGPWQRALQAAGGVRPLVFGQYGEFGSGLQTLLDELALAGAAEAAQGSSPRPQKCFGTSMNPTVLLVVQIGGRQGGAQ